MNTKLQVKKHLLNDSGGVDCWRQPKRKLSKKGESLVTGQGRTLVEERPPRKGKREIRQDEGETEKVRTKKNPLYSD